MNILVPNWSVGCPLAGHNLKNGLSIESAIAKALNDYVRASMSYDPSNPTSARLFDMKLQRAAQLKRLKEAIK